MGERNQSSISRGQELPQAGGSFSFVPEFRVQKPTFVSFPDLTPLGCVDDTITEFENCANDYPDPLRPQHVSVLLPHFYKHNCQLWILMVENIFRPKGTNSGQQKYELMLSAFDLRQVVKLQRIFRTFSDSQLYTQLKREIVRVSAPIREANLDRLLYEVQLGDKTPSELLLEMQELLGNQECPALLYKLLKERLPDSVRKIILTFAPLCPIEELALKADAILKEEQSCRSRNSTRDNALNTSTSLNESAIGGLLSNLTTAVSKLSERDSRNMMCFYIPSSGIGKNTKRDQRRVPYASTPCFPRTGRCSDCPPSCDMRMTEHNSSNLGLCYYHSRFGEQAFKCSLPC